MMMLTRVYLALTGAFFLYTAWSSATTPVAFARRLGLAVSDAGGINEIRSQYAGFFLIAGLLCFAGLASYAPIRPVIIVLLTIFGGLFIGRVGSVVLNSGFNGFGPTVSALCLIDGVGFIAAGVVLLTKTA